ncbi:MAG: sigma factor [Candidatus Eisenbacteria bacterium]
MSPSEPRFIWLEESEEKGLVRSALQGNRQAFLALADHYLKPVYRLAYSLTRDRDAAAGIAREAFGRAWFGLQGMPEGKRFFPWVLHLARNLSVAHARRHAGEALAIADVAADASAEERADVAVEQATREALRALRPDEQTALALRIVERLPHEQIGALLDQPTVIALARLSSARGYLLQRVNSAIEKSEGVA